MATGCLWSVFNDETRRLPRGVGTLLLQIFMAMTMVITYGDHSDDHGDHSEQCPGDPGVLLHGHGHEPLGEVSKVFRGVVAGVLLRKRRTDEN